jgi:effector-binding domain-containing protein
MKVLKKILVVIGIILLLAVIVSLFLPSTMTVSRSEYIKAPASVVFEQINTLKNWKNWSYWDNIDSAMISKYEGPESGVGAIHSWESKDDRVGVGSLRISESTPDKSVTTVLKFGEMESVGGWQLRDTTGGTMVTTYMTMDMKFHERLMGLMMDSWLGGDFEKSLAGLKKQAEGMPAPAKGYNVEVIKTKDQKIASTRMMTSEKTISADIGDSFKKISDYVAKNKLNMTGPVFTFFHSYSPDKIDMECAIPVDKTAEPSGDVKTSEMKAQNAAVIHYYGDYALTGAAHEAMDKWIKSNNKTMNGSPWEEYITDPMVEKDTAKWLTKIYYPID